MKKHAKLGMVGHVSHTLFWELEAGKLEIQGQPWLHSKFEASMNSMFLLSHKIKSTKQLNIPQNKEKDWR